MANNSEYAPVYSDVESNNPSNATAQVHEKGFGVGSSSKTTLWTPVRFRDLRSGWRVGASLGFLICLFVFLLNVILTIWASVRSKSNNGHIYQGSCATAKRYNMGLHVLINVLSTLLLGASNYSMQCLSAPTRNAIDRAHRECRWLDVGVQSLRNLKWAEKWKKVVWLLLGLSSLPLHLLYNSMFYSTIINTEYDLYFASEDWLQGAWYDSWSLPAGGTIRPYYIEDTKTWRNDSVVYESDPAAFLSAYQRDSSRFEKLDIEACIDAYATTYLSDRRHVALLSPFVLAREDAGFPSGSLNQIRSVQQNSSLHWVISSSNTRRLYNQLDRYGWLCNHWGRVKPGCTNAEAKSYAALGNWTISGWPVSGCISEKLPEACSVNFHLGIAIVVVVSNLGKVVCIALILKLLGDQPLLTIGDAVSSFLRTPERHTTGCCLLGREEIQTRWRESQNAEKRPLPKVYQVQKFRRWHAPGWKSWVSFLLFFGTCLVIVMGLLCTGIAAVEGTFSAIRSFGFGTARSEMIINNSSIKGSGALLKNVLVANTPQLILSGIYLTLNNLLTRFQLAVEWASYSVDRKALRVSHDRTGAQRTTYFLQLPYRIGIPLMTISATLHWLVSQSLFLVSIETYDVNGLPKDGRQALYSGGVVDEAHISACGYSLLAIICLLVVSGLVILFVLVMGAWVLPAQGIPLVGSNSVGIAAACHPSKEGNDERQPLMWGVLGTGLLVEDAVEGVKHCSLSSATVAVPVEGQLYA